MSTLWGSIDQSMAHTEGWYVSMGLGILSSGLSRFASDIEAQAFVQQKANEGSKFHIRALVEATARRLRS